MSANPFSPYVPKGTPKRIVGKHICNIFDIRLDDHIVIREAGHTELWRVDRREPDLRVEGDIENSCYELKLELCFLGLIYNEKPAKFDLVKPQNLLIKEFSFFEGDKIEVIEVV